MFTGLIEEIGIIQSIHSEGSNRRITVKGELVMDDIKIDDSISVNGVCQTVIGRTVNTFDVISIEETLQKTTFHTLKSGSKVNLERAMKFGGRMGGHIVQGHIDCVGNVVSIEMLNGSWNLWIEFPSHFSKYVVPVGSICIDGVSLTVARSESNRLMVAVIPHTYKVTILGNIKVGSIVNLEFDILGKYIEKLLKGSSTYTSVLQSWVTQPEN
ncbi:MAG: riboflavin synthase [Ignavibacteria bacterium]|nr:riboflavin synthase [Ignavibacteria bacterium]